LYCSGHVDEIKEGEMGRVEGMIIKQIYKVSARKPE
jgi:hypothetical protein